jgi:[protein-PII] uridylyltransferase
MTWNVVVDEYLSPPTESALKSLLTDALNGKFNIEARIAERIKNFRLLPGIPVPPPVVEVLNDVATGATVLEVRMHDRPGLLFSIASAITATHVEIKAAIVSTLGAEAFDSLYITELDGHPLTAERAHQIAKELQTKLQ